MTDEPEVPPVTLPSPRHETARRFAFELAAITAGILIALSIDGMMGLRRERALVRDARAAISSEIASNLRDLESTLPSLDEHFRQLERMQQLAEDLLRTGQTDITELKVALDTPSLNRASWQTAERTGALALMEFEEVRTYSETYALQQLVDDSHREHFGRIAGLTSLLYGGGIVDQATPARPQDIETFRSRVLDAMGAVGIHKELALQLAEDYRKATKR